MYEDVKRFAEKQLVAQNNDDENVDDMIIVETKNPDYKEFAVVDPWFDGKREISTEEARQIYGVNAVDKFIKEVEERLQ